MIIQQLLNFITVLKNILYKGIYSYYQKYFNEYNHILEFPINYTMNNSTFDRINLITNTNKLITTMREFLNKHYKGEDTLIVSLSGGVDSMVLLAVLQRLQENFNYKIVTATIDYSLRNESKYESEFINKYCKKYDIKNYLSTINGISRKNGSGKRSEFEIESRQIRYNLYKDLLKKYKSNFILVAHHWDDITENVFTNFMRGKNILDLAVMHEINTVNNVNIARPFLNHPKLDIYNFAHNYMIPYFKDTTPDWSNRGKMRNNIFPLLNDMFGNIFRKNLNDMGDNTKEIGTMLEKFVFEPFYKKINFYKYGVIFDIQDKKDAPYLFWDNIFMHIFHKRGTSMASKKSIKLVMESFKENKDLFYPIKKDYFLYYSDNKVNIIKDIFNNVSKINYKNVDGNYTISIKNILEGEINYKLPKNDDPKILMNINHKNIITKINKINLPIQLFKRIKLASFNEEIEYSDFISVQLIF